MGSKVLWFKVITVLHRTSNSQHLMINLGETHSVKELDACYFVGYIQQYLSRDTSVV